jgi:4-amino-4-deoxy-L-arabinose transferase-like glycosyltransferase
MTWRESRWIHMLFIIAIWAVLLLPNLGSTSFWDIDEGLNAEAAREMLESGNWIVPTFNFEIRTAKPALLYWLQVWSYQTFGVNEFAARLPSALAALAVGFLTYGLGRRMFDPTTGLLAAVIMLTSIQVCLLAHAATPDMLFLAATMVTYYLFWRGYVHDGKIWLITCSFGTSFSVLAKGPVGVVLPTAAIALFLFSRGELKRFLDWRFVVGIFLFLVIAMPWYVLVGSETRGHFLRGFWWHENVNRFLNPMDNHRGSIFFYPLVFIIGFAPWCVFLLPTLLNGWKEARDRDDRERLANRFLLFWFITYLMFFSVAATKLPNYILPSYPAFALLTARTLVRWRREELRLAPWIMPACVASVALVGLLTGLGLFIASGEIPLRSLKGNGIPGLESWAAIGLVPIAAGLVAWYWQRHGHRKGAVIAISIAGFAYMCLLINYPVKIIDTRKAPKELMAAAGLPRPKDEIRIGSLGYFQPSLVFYAQREVTQLPTEKESLEFLASPLPCYLICPFKTWDELAYKAPRCRMVAKHYDLYRNMDVVVVTNR